MDLNTPFIVTLEFDAQLTGTFFHDGTYAPENFDELLTLQPVFTAFDSLGHTATIDFLPEPQTWGLVACSLPFLMIGRRLWRTRRV